jgi:hypothetical protein
MTTYRAWIGREGVPTTQVTFVYYSPEGDVHAFAEAVAERATDAGAQVRLRRGARARAGRVSRLESGVADSQELTCLQPLVIKDTDSPRSPSRLQGPARRAVRGVGTMSVDTATRGGRDNGYTTRA